MVERECKFMKQIPGGMSCVIRKLLHVFFSDMWNFQTAGALLLHLYALVGTHKGMRVLDSNAGWEWVGMTK